MTTEFLPHPAAFVTALALRFGERGIRAGPAEIDQITALLATQENWTLDELRVLLPLVFGRMPDQHAAVLAAIEELLAAPAGFAAPESRTEPILGPYPDSDQDLRQGSSFRGKFRNYWDEVWRFAMNLAQFTMTPATLALLVLLFAALAVLVLSSDGFGEAVAVAARAVQQAAEVLADPVGRKLGDEDLHRTGIRHAVASAFFALAVLALVGAIRGIYRQLRSTSARKSEHADKPPLAGDGSVFRVGSLGGKPPCFLTSAQARTVAEMLTYRHTASDRRMLDLGATLDRHARGDWDPLVFERRRELPSVLILRDDGSDARHWNTLAAEFEAALMRHGLKVETYPFTGSLLGRRSSAKGASAAAGPDVAAGASDWMLSTIFTDLGNLSPREIDFLAGLVEQGPVLALDFSDQRLWDRRHMQIQKRGILVQPATGFGLLRGLADAFMPVRAAPRAEHWSTGGGEGEKGLPSGLAAWAAACATVQPISFALAEKLRRSHAPTADKEETLAFSVLAALEGSWVGPEGLRFSPPVRRLLLERMAQLPRDTQISFLTILDDAFGAEPDGVTAAELWRYTRARAEIFSLRQWRAEQDLADIHANGLIAGVELGDFVSRLREPNAPKVAGSVRLRMRPRDFLAAAGLRREGDSGLADSIAEIPAVWSVGLSEARTRVDIGESESEAPPLASFMDGGSSILVCQPTVSDKELFLEVNARRGTRKPLNPVFVGSESDAASLRDVAELVTFSRGRSGILSLVSGRLFTFVANGDTESGAAASLTFSAVGGTELDEGPRVFALDPTGERLAYYSRTEGAIRIVGTQNEQPPSQIQAEGRVTALAFSGSDLLLAGFQDGRIMRIAVSERQPARQSGEQTAGGEIVSLVAVGSVETSTSFTLAALADGRIAVVEQPSLLAQDFGVPWRPRSLVPFADHSAALVRNRPAGISVAVLGTGNEFDIVGVAAPSDPTGFDGISLMRAAIEPGRDGIGVLAADRGRRRLATLNGAHIEVRPLLYDLPDPAPAKAETPADSLRGSIETEEPGATTA